MTTSTAKANAARRKAEAKKVAWYTRVLNTLKNGYNKVVSLINGLYDASKKAFVKTFTQSAAAWIFGTAMAASALYSAYTAIIGITAIAAIPKLMLAGTAMVGGLAFVIYFIGRVVWELGAKALKTTLNYITAKAISMFSTLTKTKTETHVDEKREAARANVKAAKATA